MSASHRLERLRGSLASPTQRYSDPDNYPRLDVVDADGLHVHWYGDPTDTKFFELCGILASPEVAPTIATLDLRSPDTGANGTCNVDLSELLADGATFARLTTFSIQQTTPSAHHRRIVGREFAEDGALARLLAKAPMLDALTSPSAPDAAFFEIDAPHLRLLNVDAGYDTQDFMANLARSTRLTGLRSLQFGEYNEAYLDTFPEDCTPFEDCEALFRSAAFSRVSAFTWRNPVCTPAQLAALRALRPTNLQFKVIRFSQEYVRHPG